MYISSRNTDAIVKVNVSSGDVLWTLGGQYGDYDVVDFDGTRYAKGSSLWAGQHNAEYFGDDEYCMFDNQYDSGNNSRLLCVVLDESEAYAYLSWEYDTGDYSPHFGDNDRLPTGNMLGCFWPMYQYDDADQFDERAIEVTRPGGETAWQLDVKGVKCDESECKRAAGSGWTFIDRAVLHRAAALQHHVRGRSAHVLDPQQFQAVGRVRSALRGDLRRQQGRVRDVLLHAALARHARRRGRCGHHR